MAGKIVWVLGAGASRALGGPLLDDLLAPASREDAKIRYKDTELGKSEAGPVWWLYAYGSRFKHGIPPEYRRLLEGETIWENAEVFLDYLDVAAHQKPDQPLHKRITEALAKSQAGWKITVPDLWALARRAVAAQCCAFLDDADISQERWDPYRRWNSVLGSGDVIITFNYDRVVETVSEKVEVLLPNSVDLLNSMNGPALLKLHGSVDWQAQPNGVGGLDTYKISNPHFALTCPPEQICIGTPGPYKKIAAGHLGKLWSAAAVQIQNADAIVFVGYRFPPTDAQARMMILQAIRTNKRPLLNVHTVLGSDRAAGDRLTSLLNFVVAGRSAPIVQHPLLAEDFFSVFDRDALLPIPVQGQRRVT